MGPATSRTGRATSNPMDSFPPGLVLVLGAVAVAVLPGRLRPWAFVGVAVVVFVQMIWVLEDGDTWATDWLGFHVMPLRVDDLSLVFGFVFATLAVVGGVYALHMRDRAQQVAALLYGGGALGVVFAGDLLTLVGGWELMAVASTVLILGGQTLRSKAAAMRYLFVHILGGSVLLAGVLWHVGSGGGLAFEAFDGGTASWLILGGVAINAAVVPLHAWLTDAYPEASITGAIFLGGFTTKTAVYVLARGYPEWDILIWAGVVMAVYGVAFALVQNDVRRLLAYDIVSQVGLMVAAVGIGGESGINAVAAHAFAHVIYNALLFMAAGALIYATGRSKLSELGGIGRALPLVLALYMVGALSVSAFPGFNAYATKFLVIHAAEEEHLRWVVFTLYAVSAGTFVAAGLRLPYLLFAGRGDARVEREVPGGMYVAMAAVAVLSVGFGVYPDLLYDPLPFAVEATPYTAANIVRTLQLLSLAGLAWWLVRGRFGANDVTYLDVDWLYRRAGKPVRVLVQQPLERVLSAAERAAAALANSLGRLATAPDTAWAGLLSRTGYARRHGLGATLSLVGRPPLGAAIAAVLFTFAALIIVVLVN